MKTLNWVKFIIVALSVVLILSLVACGNNATTDTEAGNNDTTAAEDNNTTEAKDNTDNTETEDNNGNVTEESDSEAETDSETETTPVVPACQHTECTETAAKAATCTEGGNEAYKICNACSAILDAEGNTIAAIPTIEALGHTEVVDAGTPADCENAGTTEGKHCSVCNEVLVAQETIEALGHKVVEKTWTAPTTAEEGWEAHKACENCGKAWTTEGEELDAVPTIEKIVPTANKYFGAEELKNKLIAGTPGSLFNAPEVSADRTYVRFSRAGASNDGNVMFFDSNTTVTGKYFVLKYRTDHMTSGEFWANTTEAGHSGGKANFFASFLNDGEWHILILDLNQRLPNYVQADGDGNYIIQWSRIDLLNGSAESGYFDIAYAVYCDDLSKVASAMQEGDNDICPHFAFETPVYTNEGDKHSTACAVCGAKSYENHYAANSVVWSSENKCYTGTCICGAEVVSDMIYKTEGYSETNAGSANNFITATKEDGFIRYTATKAASDSYFYPYRNGTTVTGKFMVIKYRMANNGKNATIQAPFAGSAAFGKTGADGKDGDSQNAIFSTELIADGDWHYLVVTPKEANASFTPNADGTYSWGFFRIKVLFDAFDSTCYVDIAEIAFADNQEAAEYYAYKNDSLPPFRYNFDQSNNEIDGAQFLSKSEQANGCLTLDMSGKTLTTPTSLTLGGWVCTPGGASAYYIRVTKIDGAAVEAPELVKWQDGTNRGDIYTAWGKAQGYTEASGHGAGFAKAPVDLTAWAGHTIDFELVAVTNYGATVVFGNFQNLAVPAAQAE